MGLPADRWRVWLHYYRDEVRLLRATAIFVLCLGLFAAALVWLLQTTGSVETVRGRVEALGYRETDFGSIPSASIIIEGRPVRIDLPARFGCMIGDVIEVRRRPTRLGFTHGIGRNPNPCSRAHPPFPPLALLPIWLPNGAS